MSPSILPLKMFLDHENCYDAINPGLFIGESFATKTDMAQVQIRARQSVISAAICVTKRPEPEFSAVVTGQLKAPFVKPSAMGIRGITNKSFQPARKGLNL